MNNMFADIQKVVPLSRTPRRVLYQGPPESPIVTLYKAMGEVAVVRNPPIAVDQGDVSRPGGSGKTPEKAHSSQVRRKSTGCDGSGCGQSPVRRTSDRSRTPDKSRTPIKCRTPEREATSWKGKYHAHQVSPSSFSDCLMLEPTHTPPSRAASVRDSRHVSSGRHLE